ncbi:MAG: efflux RND transporter periplasmic adaptor subunit [Acetobacteraceae bacterium]
MSRRAGVFAALAGIVVLGGALLIARSPARPAESPAAEAAPVPVTVTRVSRENVPIYLLGLGQVQALNTVDVKAEVSGILEETPFKEGDEVKAGTELALIDPRPYQAVLDQALAKQAEDQAQLANARSDLARYSALASKNFASRQQLDTQRATVAQDTALLEADAAAIEAARLNLEFTRITAPIDGRLGLRQMDPGNLIEANSPTGIVTLTQMKPIGVLFTLPQADLARVRAAAAKGTLSVLAMAGNSDTVLDRGTLETIDNTVDPTTGTFRLKAVFPNTAEALWPGAFVNAKLLLTTLESALTLPARAVQHGPDGLYVYVVRPDGTVARQAVKEASEAGEVAVIESGIAAGTEVVLDGQSRLRNGTRITVSAGA